MPDDRLEEVLASVGRHLAVRAEGPAPASGVRWPHRLLAAAVLIAVLALVVAVVAPARRTVGDWFRAGRIEVELTRDTAADETLPVFTDAVEPIDPAVASEVLGVELPDVAMSDLGAPRDWWTIPEGGVVVGWPDGTSLWMTRIDEEGVGKMVPDADDVEVADLGDYGFVVVDDHILLTPHRRVAAGAAVVWVDGGLTYRLEGPAAADGLLAVARQLSG
jgi:hypothetical protein